jgi:branched-chain amino acid transport system permease protein
MRRVITVGLVILLLLVLAALPFAVKKDSVINLVILVLLYVTLASGWNLLGGYTGQTNLGYAAFFGLGSLITRQLWTSGFPLLPSMLAGCAVAVAIGTLALAQILFVTVGNEFPLISALPAKALATYDLLPRYYVFLAMAVATVGTAYWLVHSRMGLGMMAVREQEDAAESLGVSAMRHKLIALVASAFFAGLAGGAFAYYHVSYYPQFPFAPVWTFDAVMMTYIGGVGTIVGPVIGAVFYVVVKEYLALNLVELHLIVFGVLFILVVLFLPGGLVEAWTKIRRMLRRSKAKETEPSPTA